MARLKDLYKKEIIKKMETDFGYTNVMEVPKITKIVVNIGVGQAITNSKLLDELEKVIAKITGQKPIRTIAKKSIAGFKLREGYPIGLSVIMRGERMYDFLDRLVNVALPRVRDFRGIKPKAFDGKGNYSLGINEHTVFPEVSHDDIVGTYGLQVNINTTATNDEEAKKLLEYFGFPFKKDGSK
ncbi:50S ribosomal protein L5 [bacterium CG2_30_37_16]|nr:MAG: 50S ribosomal protein L5 [bacterium CG2_30_37_16]PIP30717.1 MAG: 50S ribosomal protein L5 [bacterium (Candidatus Howlettbacteria) CG23_combo_of_CG06-09_8_20_14_all_37_9]PIX99255.1 MAG: 50S ribosomal protein L5 [bacterium (Candidatus Howlettbacteria) CG_4_10_14_3_um_filter_37_10]PJB05572.1 MAG: 50S ribosomal protein L5 [bacterium (Candidatus Howlettbacteria) CG_4_9_14_3_um_filter_37_10]